MIFHFPFAFLACTCELELGQLEKYFHGARQQLKLFPGNTHEFQESNSRIQKSKWTA
jgi:hypothetical protein